MINKLSKLKYWEIAVLGLALSAVVNVLIMILIRFLNGTWPQVTEAAHIAYLITAAASAWIITGIFVEAGLTKWRRAKVDDYLDLIAAGVGRHRADEVYDQEKDNTINLDELAEELGLTPKGADRG